jgi:hypothetical protein
MQAAAAAASAPPPPKITLCIAAVTNDGRKLYGKRTEAGVSLSELVTIGGKQPLVDGKHSADVPLDTVRVTPLCALLINETSAALKLRDTERLVLNSVQVGRGPWRQCPLGVSLAICDDGACAEFVVKESPKPVGKYYLLRERMCKQIGKPTTEGNFVTALLAVMKQYRVPLPPVCNPALAAKLYLSELRAFMRAMLAGAQCVKQ